LTRLQEAHWTPLIKWAEERFNVPIQVAAGQLFNQQPKETVEKLKDVVSRYDPWRLAGTSLFTSTFSLLSD
jgi:ATP synthase F1 complex assembly factor 2